MSIVSARADGVRVSSLMTADEARACVARATQHLNVARAELLELYEREGWRALGYDSWRACVTAEFSQSQSYLYYQLQAARTERELSTIVQPAELPSLREFHLRQIAELPAPERREVALELARQELTSEQHRQLIAERTRAARNSRVVATQQTGTLPRSVDVREADAAALPWDDGSIDLIVTSPPYNLAKDYDGADDDLPYAEYLERARAWAAEMHRVAGAQGRLCLNVAIDSTRGAARPLYADWLAVLMDAGWSYRTTVVWADNDIGRHTARGSASPSAVHVMTPVEVIGVLHKGEWSLGRRDAHDLEHEEWLTWTHGLWRFPNNHSGRWGHPCPFPAELARRCIKLFSFPGATVCDPFLGSGTTAVIASQLGRQVVASDISAHYVALARARLSALVEASA